MKILFTLLVLVLLSGCAARYQAGLGYNAQSNTLTLVDRDTGETLWKEDLWDNPVAIIGVAYPLTDHLVIDYRHISSLGGSDLAVSDAVSLLFEFKGSDVINALGQ